MFRLTFVLLFVLQSFFANAIKCQLQTIETDYNRSRIIFYGKYIGRAKSADFYNNYGEKIRVDNFIVYKSYKGILNSSIEYLKKDGKEYIISLILRDFELDYGYKFDSGSNYLVYAFRDPLTGVFTTSGCFRTRKIINDNFIGSWSYDRDKGKDEQAELLELYNNDQNPEKDIRVYANAIETDDQKYLNEIDRIKQLYEYYRSVFVISLIIALLSIFYIIYLKTKKTG